MENENKKLKIKIFRRMESDIKIRWLVIIFIVLGWKGWFIIFFYVLSCGLFVGMLFILVRGFIYL